MGSLVLVLLVIMLFDEEKRPINRKKRSRELFRILRNPVCFRKCNKSAFIPLWDAERRLTENEVSKMIQKVQGDSTQIVLLPFKYYKRLNIYFTYELAWHNL